MGKLAGLAALARRPLAPVGQKGCDDTLDLHCVLAAVDNARTELKHVGKLDKAIMGHNWVLLKMGTDVQAFAMAAIDAKDTGYIPGDHKDKVVANTKVLGGGESDTITFTVAEPGTYTFICSFPGHSAMMKGELVVAAAPTEGSAG